MENNPPIRENFTSHRLETLPFAGAFVGILGVGCFIFMALVFWALPALWLFDLNRYTLDDGRVSLGFDFPYSLNESPGIETPVILLSDAQGRLVAETIEGDSIEAIEPADEAWYIEDAQGRRLAIYLDAIWRDGEAWAQSTDFEFRDKVDAELDIARELRAQIRRIQLRELPLSENNALALQAGLDRILDIRNDLSQTQLIGRLASGEAFVIDVEAVLYAVPVNGIGGIEKLWLYAKRVVGFLLDDPIGGSVVGGVFPALFGTFFLTLVMSVIVAPLGVIVAVYLNEYARPGPLLSGVRIALNNLAGVPSVIYGVFGLGGFVYFVGGNLDILFFSENLPSPTLGTGGVLWASLTLALMTLPVVIVTTEESLQAVPNHVRETSMALGASRWQTLWKVVLPNATPGLLTGLILAVARAAGEVAPLMLLGVTKLAANLPVSAEPPFVHLDRKFMHLGYHVYDQTFHSANSVEAVPFVFMTALVLVLMIVLINLTAILIRGSLLSRRRVQGI